MQLRPQRGFTLLELMVAISILAVTFASLMHEGAQVSRNTKVLKDKTFAHWVAMNKAAEISLDTHLNGTFPNSSMSDEVEMGGMSWQVETEISNTPNPNLRKAEINVGRKSGNSKVASIVMLVRNPKPKP